VSGDRLIYSQSIGYHGIDVGQRRGGESPP
jgi:hypothetical protein